MEGDSILKSADPASGATMVATHLIRGRAPLALADRFPAPDDYADGGLTPKG